LYRIAQEALNNALKHSRATEVLLRLSTGQEQVEMEVADNGIGFDLGKVTAKGGGMGLTNMRERAEKLGGSLTIHTAPDNGTAIDVRISI
jgi:signal transduction histidine kinase